MALRRPFGLIAPLHRSLFSERAVATFSRFLCLRPFSSDAALSKNNATTAAETSFSASTQPIPLSFSSNRLNKTLFRGVTSTDFSNQCEFVTDFQSFPVFRCLTMEGKLAADGVLPFPLDVGVKMLQTMLRLKVYDQVLYDIQRQGRISFYMTSSGEEAATVGSSAALSSDDVIFSQYRELGALLWRGFTLKQILDQCFGTSSDEGKGRQMPVHYSCRELNWQCVSSPLTTQLPQASGAGFAFQLKDLPHCSVAYFGEGAASEGDFATAINFASVLKSQTLFLCRNNTYAISTPVEEQYGGDGVAVRGPAYGIPSIRVDGNDIVAVYTAVSKAREFCIQKKTPILIEFMTYRVGHHSTSDESSRYREISEMQEWKENFHSPIARFEKFLNHQNMWTVEQTQSLIKESRKEIIEKIKIIEAVKHSSIEEGLFSDVYDILPWHLKEQKSNLKEFLNKYKEKYDIHRYE